MRRLRRVVERTAVGLLLIGGFGTLICMLLGTGDVLSTKFIGWPIPGAKELTESTMVLIVFGALTYAQIRKGHIRVELIYTRVSAQGRAAMDMITMLAALLFYGLLLWQGIVEAVESWRIQEADVGLIRFPLYPARSVLVAGTAVLILQLVLDLRDNIRSFMGKHPVEPLEIPPSPPKIPEA